jgi:hypothetical protein
MLSDPRSRQRLVVVAALLLGMVLGAGALRLSGAGRPDDGAALAGDEPTAGPTATDGPTPGVATRWTISSLNVLGDDHTAKGGNKHGWAPGTQRMLWLTQVIRDAGVDVIGLQEFQYPQYQVFERELGADFDTYPALAWGKKGTRNSVAWRSAEWSLVSGSWIKIPYFHGTILRMPVVLLRNNVSGQQAYFSSFHNPADARGPAARWRKQATDLEVAMVNRLRSETGLPVYVTGDMNERDIYFCRMTAGTDMVSASGGSNGTSGCSVTRPTYIDWVFGSPETTFTGYTANRSAKVRRSTDHPMIVAQAELPPPLTTEPSPTDCPTPSATGTPSAAPSAAPTATATTSTSGSPRPNVPSPTS